MAFGRDAGPKPDRQEDTQLPVGYRGSAWVRDDGGPDGPRAGDHAPDAGGLRRHGVGFPLRVFDMLRGTEPALLAHLPAGAGPDALPRPPGVRIVAITAEPTGDRHGIAMLHDADGHFAATYGGQGAAWLARPDGYLAWRGPAAGHPGLNDILSPVFGLA